MKKILPILLALATLAGVASCTSNTYSNKRKAEDKLIANYIKRNHITVLDELPADDHEWAENEYYRVSGYDDLYFHLISRGDSLRADSSAIDPVQSGDKVNIRYKKFALTENPDTTSIWTTIDSPSPVEVIYPTGYSSTCLGWMSAIQLMRYSDSKCQIICPSKQGFSDDENSVTPYIYILSMRIKH